MTERNKSMMEYNRRLFATAKLMPRAERLKMLGIIYSNIKEFISVRMPRDTDAESVQNEVDEFLSEFSAYCKKEFTMLTTPVDLAGSLDYPYDPTPVNLDINDVLNKYGIQKCELSVDQLPSGFYLASEDGTIFTTKERGRFQSTIELGIQLNLYRRVEYELDRAGLENLITFEIIRSHATSPVDVTNVDDASAYISVVRNEPIAGIIFGCYGEDYETIHKIARTKLFKIDSEAPAFVIDVACVGWDKIASAVYKDTTKKLENVDDRSRLSEIVFTDMKKSGWVYFKNTNTTIYRTPYMDYYHILHYLFEKPNPHVEIEDIYISLYRFELSGFLYRNLINLARFGRARVHVLIELTARDNESTNIQAAKELRRYGVDVCYGIPGFKVHGKACVILARDPDLNVRLDVAHIATGNYSEAAQSCFCDTHMVTRDPVYVHQILNMLLTAMHKKAYLDTPKDPIIWMSPTGMRDKLDQLIQDACRNAKLYGAKYAQIRIKCNNICDDEIVKKLYEAADMGVQIHIVCRSVCTMRPRKNLKITSIVGQYLEHDRLFIFGQDGREEVYMSSADLMYRNLDRRIEFMVKIPNKAGLGIDYVKYLKGNIFDAESTEDGSIAVWDMNEDGDWIYRMPKN